MLSEQCISVTELAKNTSGIIKRSSRIETQYVFVNNKPQAVILSIREYEALQKNGVEFGSIHTQEVSEETIEMYRRAKELPKEKFIDL